MIRFTFATIVIMVLGLVQAQAQNGLPQFAGARGAGMANASGSFKDVNSVFVNQAGLAYVEHMSFTAFGESRFLGTNGVNSFLIGAALPFEELGTFGLSINYFGFEAYNEQKIGLAYAKKLSKRMALGAQIDYLGTNIMGYGTSHNITFELGLLAELSKTFTLGAHVFSPARLKLENGDEIPALLKISGAFKPSNKVLVTGQIEKDLDNTAIGRIGIEYHPMDVLYVRAGATTGTSMGALGIGLRLNGLDIDLATNYHQYLGLTPSVSITYTVGREVAKGSTGH